MCVGVGGGGAHVKIQRSPIKILFWCQPREEMACGMQPSEGSAVKGIK